MRNLSQYHLRVITSLLVSLCLIAIAPPAQAQSSVQVRFAPAETQVPVNGTAQIAVEVADVQALYGIDIALSFDPSVIEVVGAAPDQKAEVALGKFLDAGFTVMNKVDNAAGTVRFVMTQLNPSEPKDGTGVLIVLNVRGKKQDATSALKFTKVDMARRDGTTFSGTLQPGQVKVVAASQAVPAASPIPTQAAGTAMPAATHAAPTVTAPAAAPPAKPTNPPAATQKPQVGVLDDTAKTLLVGGCSFGIILIVILVAIILIPLFRRMKR